jgi:hypothetical protein
MKVTTAAAGVTALGLLVWGGIQIADDIQCSNLEEDYLNAMSDLKSSLRTRTLMMSLGKPGSERDADFDYMVKIRGESILRIHSEIYEKCGKRAADTASRKAQSAVF